MEIHDTEEHGRGRPPKGAHVKKMRQYIVTLPPEMHNTIAIIGRNKDTGRNNFNAGVRKLYYLHSQAK